MIFLQSDNVFLWSGLQDSVTLAYVNDATITGSLQDLEGNELQSFSFSYISASDGDYQGTLTAAQTDGLESCREYVVEIVATRDSSTITKRERTKTSYLGYK